MRTHVNRALAIMAVLVMAAASLVTPASAQGQTIAEIAVGNADFSTLVTALSEASANGPTDFLAVVSDPSQDLTVFAPTNAAFAALGATLDAALADPAGLLTDVLAYHVSAGSQSSTDLVAAGSAATLQGEAITIEEPTPGLVLANTVQIVTADIQASNGVIHVIDAVLLPPSIANPPADPAPAAPAAATPAAEEEPSDLPTIAEVASGDHRFTTLVNALATASKAPGGTDFLAAVSDPNASLTVFAPTNEALWALGDTLDAALADPGGLLTDVLAYHVVGSSNDAAALAAAGSATTLGGESVTITAPSFGRVLVNDANVVIADIQTANGIIHVIDAVLIPASVTNPPADTSGAGSFDYPDTPDDFVGRSGSVAAAAAPAGGGEALAATGSESTVYLITAGMLLLAGAFVILSRDRRELALVTGRLGRRSVSTYAWPSQPEHPEHHSFSDALD